MAKYELIVCEKPSAALKIAAALADGKPIKKNIDSVPYYEITHNGRDIVIACAVGHLYTVAEKTDENSKKPKWGYPVFDVEWKQTSLVRKDASFAAKYVRAIKKLSGDADKFTVACDYDIEGEVIGYNIIHHICKQKDAKRMKFSTLTKDELVESYEHSAGHLDWGQANAGLTRHVLDFFYGINLSRALSQAIKKAGRFKVMSSGRVQGPALKIIVDKEKEIKAFKPVPFWQIEMHAKAKQGGLKEKKEKEISKNADEKEIDPDLIIALHEKDKFWEKKDADKIYAKVKDRKQANVDDVERKRFNQSPPFPFDLTTLQTEAYRCLGIAPKTTLEIAQELYLKGMISYPRTSSQQLPESIGFKKILSALKNLQEYRELAAKLIDISAKKKLTPNNGKKTDPAHPAIFPTGIYSPVEGWQMKIYDIIVRRFLATFGEDAVRETMTIRLEAEKEIFIAKGTRTVEKGWHIYYGRHVKLEEEELPPLKKGEAVDIKKMLFLAKETSPPKRYTPASIIKELENRGLGTKSTRAQIVENLYDRGYVKEKSIEATEIGIRTVEILEKYCPEIVDEKLTRTFEEEMDQIRENKKNSGQILDGAKNILLKVLSNFKKKEAEIGKELLTAEQDTIEEQNYIGMCPVCKEGKLGIRRGKFGRFIACDRYPECKTTFSLPHTGNVRAAEKNCEKCGYPMLSITMKRRGKQEICLNPDCPSKKIDEAEAKSHEKACPKCKDGRLVVRKSIYGSFLGCNKYPKCRYIEKLNGNNGNNKDGSGLKAASRRDNSRKSDNENSLQY